MPLAAGGRFLRTGSSDGRLLAVSASPLPDPGDLRERMLANLRKVEASGDFPEGWAEDMADQVLGGTSEKPRYTIEEIKAAMATLPAIEAAVLLLNSPFDSERETKAEFTLKAFHAGLDIAATVLSEGLEGLQVRTPKCPNCGSLDVDLDATDLEAKHIVCYRCGEGYELTPENSIPASEAS